MTETTALGAAMAAGAAVGVWNLESDKDMPTLSLDTFYAFLRQPRTLFKQLKNASVELLLQELSDWNQEVSNNLDVKQIEDIRPQIYFEREHRRRREQRASLVRKTLTSMSPFSGSLNI